MIFENTPFWLVIYNSIEIALVQFAEKLNFQVTNSEK